MSFGCGYPGDPISADSEFAPEWADEDHVCIAESARGLAMASRARKQNLFHYLQRTHLAASFCRSARVGMDLLFWHPRKWRKIRCELLPSRPGL
jgi:hypothetical protein